MKQVLDRHGVRATVSLNASVCLSYPQLVEESLKSGWEMLAHGFIQRVINREPDERAVIRKAIDTIAESTGAGPPRLDGPRLGRDLRHARHPGRGGHRVHRRLVQRPTSPMK